jgi:hypothetical protein
MGRAAVSVNGFGGDQCGQYSEAYRIYGQAGYSPYINWLQGFATGLSLETSIHRGKYIDYMNGVAIESAAVWLNNYCQQNATNTFITAAEKFLEHQTGEQIPPHIKNK